MGIGTIRGAGRRSRGSAGGVPLFKVLGSYPRDRGERPHEPAATMVWARRSGRLAVIGVGQIGGSVALGARGRARWARSPPRAASRPSSSARRRSASSIAQRVDGGGGARGRARGAGDAGGEPGRGRGGDRAGSWPPGAMVFDVGSVKGAAMAAVEPELPPGAFVACHPLAGTERVGPGRGQPAPVRREALRDLPDAAAQRGGGRAGRAAVGGDGRRAGADDGGSCTTACSGPAATCRTWRPTRWQARSGAARPRRASRGSGGCRRPACATRPAWPRRARPCGATSCSITAQRCCRLSRCSRAAWRSCARRSRPAMPGRIEKLLVAGKAGRDRIIAG